MRARTPQPREKAPALGRGQGWALVGLGVLLVAELLNVSTYNQAFNIFPVWAKEHVALGVAGFQPLISL